MDADFRDLESKAVSDFIESYNSGLLYPELFNIIGRTARSSLYRKAKIYEASGQNYHSLIPGYGTGNKFSSKLCLMERYYLLKI